MKIGFIGAGKVGTTLAKAFVEAGLNVVGFYSRSPKSAQFSAQFTGSEAFQTINKLVTAADLILLTVSDDALPAVIETLRPLPLADKTICHTSGVYSIDDLFADRAQLGALGVGLHPLYPFHDKTTVWQSIKEATFTIEGDTEAATTLQNTLASLGFTVKPIAPTQKAAYHAAASIACNFTCPLMAQSLSLMARSGFSEREALDALRPLLEANLQNILAVGPESALTGPIDRNDIGTVTKHLNALETDTDRRHYAVTALRLVDIARQRHPDENYQTLIHLLEQYA